MKFESKYSNLYSIKGIQKSAKFQAFNWLHM